MPDKGKEPAKDKKTTGKKEEFPGYPVYPESEDIYSRSKEETEIDPEFTDKKKAPVEDPDAPSVKSFEDDMTGGDLDIPGSELDDQQEDIGSEDEENNYYSLGGDKKD